MSLVKSESTELTLVCSIERLTVQESVGSIFIIEMVASLIRGGKGWHKETLVITLVAVVAVKKKEMTKRMHRH